VTLCLVATRRHPPVPALNLSLSLMKDIELCMFVFITLDCEFNVWSWSALRLLIYDSEATLQIHEDMFLVNQFDVQYNHGSNLKRIYVALTLRY